MNPGSGQPVALVTGGARGIGAAVARRLGRDGMRVAVADVDEEAARAVAAEIGPRALGLRMDVSAEDSIARGIALVEDRLGVVDRLAACAGVVRINRFEAVTRSQWQRTLDVNAWGTYLCFREVGERLRSLGRAGQMLAIASIAARGPNALAPDYGASKAAVVNLVRTAAVVYAPHAVTVNAVCPGIIETAMIHEVHARVGELTHTDGDVALAKRIATIPLGRIGSPDDVAGAISFLLSADATYITGQALNVCGGIEFD